ncbi:MAG: hypothetical protein PHN77_19130 [Thermoguttaceae bacterium]|nr:hypothetical protein [Thermoguttaceae bacterium]MDI9445857.1 hypothetical protein [Planctomycetota bacterium]
MDCTTCFRHFGTLRCLVNVLGRSRREDGKVRATQAQPKLVSGRR